MAVAGLLLVVLAGALGAQPVPVTMRQQMLRQGAVKEWEMVDTVVNLDPSKTAIITVDMWDRHWCPSATTRVAELATPMNQFIGYARNLSFNIIWAPSEVTQFYSDSPARKNVEALPNKPLPSPHPKTVPHFPLNTNVDAGCDTPATEHKAWSRQIATLDIHDSDFLITASPWAQSQQELWNIISARGLTTLIYQGVHENMCIMNRPFALEQVTSWGFDQQSLAVVRELVDVMYNRFDPPYVSHSHGVRVHTDYVEKYWARSMSMYDILQIGYKNITN